MENMDLLKAMREMMANMKANQANMERLISSLAYKIDANQAQMEAIVHSIRLERQEIHKGGAAVTCLECEEQGPKEWESGAERQMVPTEEVARKSSRVTKKRPRGRHIAAGRRVKPTKKTRGDCESRRKLVAASRKVSRCAAVAWRRKSIFRNLRTQGICGPRQGLGASGKTMTLRAGLARRKGTFAKKNQTRNKAGRRASRQPFGKRRWMYRECKNGTTGIRNQSSRQQARLRSERTHSRIVGREIRLDIRKQNARSAMMWSIKDWTLWRGRPPPKRLKS
jgi:hypothetical protein